MQENYQVWMSRDRDAMEVEKVVWELLADGWLALLHGCGIQPI